jgi:hypothetical protein
MNDPSYTFKLDVIRNLANNSKCSSSNKKLHSLFRGRGTVFWNDLKKHNNEEYIEGLNDNTVIDDNEKNVNDFYDDETDEVDNETDDHAALIILTRAILQGLESPAFVSKDLIYLNKLNNKMKLLFDFTNTEETKTLKTRINTLNNTSFQYEIQNPIASHTETEYEKGIVKRCQVNIKKKMIYNDDINANTDSVDDDNDDDNDGYDYDDDYRPLPTNLMQPLLYDNISSASATSTYDLDIANLVTEQKDIVIQVMTYLIQQMLYYILPDSYNKPKPIYLLIHGGPGNGKSFILKSILNNFKILVARIKVHFDENDYNKFMPNTVQLNTPRLSISNTNKNKKFKTNSSENIRNLNNRLCITATTGK